MIGPLPSLSSSLPYTAVLRVPNRTVGVLMLLFGIRRMAVVRVSCSRR